MRRPRHRAYHANADINIANLVDVVLVVLIIFMISAPLLQSSIDINLPKTTVTVTEEKEDVVVVTVDAKGGIYINDRFTRPDAFIKQLQDEMTKKHTKAVYFRGDSSLAYGAAIGIIGKLKEIGVETIGLVTSPEDADGKKRRR